MVSFGGLSPETQARLIELQTPAPERFVFIDRPSKLWYAAIAGATGWLVFLFASTQDYLWQDWMFWLMAAATLVILPLGLSGVYRVVSAKVARLKDGAVFTADECIISRGGKIEFWSLRELEGFLFREDIRMIEVWIGEKMRKIAASDIDEGHRLNSRFVDLRNNAGDSFLRPLATGSALASPSDGLAFKIGGVAGFVAIAVVVSFAARRLNTRYDDDMTWNRVSAGTTVGDFTEYRTRHPHGIHKTEADQKIADILGRLRGDYKAKLKKNAVPAAVEGLDGFLDSLGKLEDRNVYVRVSEKRELDDAVVKKMRQDFGLQIAAYDYSVPPSEVPFRKDMLTKELGVAFANATRPASIEFVLTDNPPPNTTVVDLNYVIKSRESYYAFQWYSNGSITTFFNPAASFDFDFTLRSADGRELYRQQYSSLFTKLQPIGFFDDRDSANYSFDKVYFASVAKDLSAFLSREFGFTE